MISVIIPLFNAEKTVIKALESIKAQTVDCGLFEIIIVDDCSTDTSARKVEKFIKENPQLQIKFIQQKENKGVSFSRNNGLKISKGEFIAFLDADDFWAPNKTEKQLNFLKNSFFNIDFISCRINDNKLFFPYKPKNNLAEITLKKLIIRNGIATPTVIYKRKVLDNTGFFDENQRYAEDHNYWLKISMNNKMYILDESLVIAGNGKRTFGVSGLSANLKEMKKGFAKNILDVFKMNKINFAEYLFLKVFYEFKYIILLIRQFYYKKLK